MIIYSTPTCPRCKLLMAAFQKAGIPYEEGVLDASVISECLTETDEWVTSAPLIRDGACWFFATDFFDLSGNLLKNWRQVLEGVKPRKTAFGGDGGAPSDKEQQCKTIWGNTESLK